MPNSQLNLLPPPPPFPLDLGVSLAGKIRGHIQFSLLGEEIGRENIGSEPEIQLPENEQDEMWTERSLHTLPYDLLLNITTYLDFDDIHALHLTCKSLYYSTTTRPVYRKLATDLLRRCRPLPLKGFQRLMDLSSEQLIVSVNKAHHYERSWRARGPRPARGRRNIGAGNGNNHYLDNLPPDETRKGVSWYRVLQSPPYEEVDWLSPITSSYILCATKTGKVVCWDVQTDKCLAEWVPGEKWELWKCRVEFDEKVVYFTMAKVLNGSYDDTRLMHFSLMRLSFVDSERSQGPSTPSPPPSFSHVTSFRTTGVVMNIFLLDPSARLLSAFIWVSESNTIGLYVLLDWDRDEYVFVDTGIECVISSNWSCILYANNIVIHCEDSDSAFQHFYPLSHLEDHIQKVKPSRTPTSDATIHGPPNALGSSMPVISGRVRPWESIVKRFKFPRPIKIDRRLSGRPFSPSDDTARDHTVVGDDGEQHSIHLTAGLNGEYETASDNLTSTSTSTAVEASPSLSSTSALTPSITDRVSELQWESQHPNSPPTPPPPLPDINPFPFPPWYPESAHFVRQWWPSLPGFVNSHAHYRRRGKDDDGHDDDSHGRYSSPYPLSRSGGVNTDDSHGDLMGASASAAGPGGVPRVSCTVVLLASHDPSTHRTRFVLMQHYFRVPMRGANWVELRQRGRRLPGAGLDLGEGGFGASAYNVNNTGAANGHGANGTGTGDESDDSSGGAGNAAGPSNSGPISSNVPAATANHSSAGGHGGDESEYSNAPLELYMIDEPPDGSVVVEACTRERTLAGEDTSYLSPPLDEEDSKRAGKKRKKRKSGKFQVDPEDDPMNIWYVADPFEVVCVLDSPSSDDEGDQGEGSDDEAAGHGGNGAAGNGGDDERGHERPRPLVAVDFGHAVWIEYVPDEEQQLQHKGKEVDHHDEDIDDDDEAENFYNWHTVRHERPTNGIGTESDPKRLRFVTFPPYVDVSDSRRDIRRHAMGEVRTLEVPPELDLDNVETINIDQSQGAVILSIKSGQIFILCYE
ncbi:hypothetical protein PQX77_004875 [Marasmius sp. AFHP31]|nr:hypothetical protein PQX77_004875 [Marasmius sp. AFHP31]